MFCFNHASAFYTNNKIVKMLMNNKLKAQSLNRKFTLSCFSVTCSKHVGLLLPISALDRKQVRGYQINALIMTCIFKGIKPCLVFTDNEPFGPQHANWVVTIWVPIPLRDSASRYWLYRSRPFTRSKAPANISAVDGTTQMVIDLSNIGRRYFTRSYANEAWQFTEWNVTRCIDPEHFFVT